MIADEQALVRAIIANPADDLPRLVYADWLEESGEPARAEFIREQCELPHLEPGSPLRAEIAGRHELVIRAYRREWFGAFARTGVEFRTARGFIEAVTTGPAELAECGEEWFAEQPITRLKLTGVFTQSGSYRKWYHRELFRSPLLGRLAALDLSSAGVNAAGVYWLSRNPALSPLRELSLRSNPIDDEGAETLARMPALRTLRSLDVSGTDLTDIGGRAIAGSPHLAGLEELRITGRFDPRTWEMLAERYGKALAR